MIIQVALVIFVYMTVVFVVAHYLKDNSIVDVFWEEALLSSPRSP